MKTLTPTDEPKAKPAGLSLPHDWTYETWPPDVYPYDKVRAQRMVKFNRDKLLAAHALTRIGREIVILGAGYARWLASNARRVTEYEVAANRPENAPKRFGRAG
jgi:hypothetical protein